MQSIHNRAALWCGIYEVRAACAESGVIQLNSGSLC